MMVTFGGWRGMFIAMGVIGISVGVAWYVIYRDRNSVHLEAGEIQDLEAGDIESGTAPLTAAEWRGLFSSEPCGP